MKLKDMMAVVFATEGESRQQFAKECYDKVLAEEYKINVDKENRGAFGMMMLRYFVRADHWTSNEEFTFLRDFFHWDNMYYHEFKALMSGGENGDFQEYVEDIMKYYSNEGKIAFCYFGLCILLSDEVLTPPEMQLFESILATLKEEEN